MIDRASMDTSELEELDAREAQAKADAINVRATWRHLKHREDSNSNTALWAALMRVSAGIQNGVFERATTLLETRETEMDVRCEPHLEGWPRVSGPIERRDAVAMQTITSSYIDALDQVSSVLDTMVGALIDQQHRAIENEAREGTAVDRALMAAENELAPASEDIAAMDADRISSTGERISELEQALKSHGRAHAEMVSVRDQLFRCRAARAQVMTTWRLALKLEAELAKIAH